MVDLGAADGVISHGLIRDLAEQRAGRPLIHAELFRLDNPYSRIDE